MEIFATAWLLWLGQHLGLGVKALVGGAGAIAERSLPAFQPPESRGKTWPLRRILGNSGVYVFSTLTASAFALAAAQALSKTSLAHYGLMRQLPCPDALKIALTVVLLDFYSYGIHRLEHRVPFLWRFHRFHHTDRHVDLSTTIRKHPLSVIFSTAFFLIATLALGVSPGGAFAYVLISDAVSFLVHSSMAFPTGLSRLLQAVFIVAPADHRLHHSDWQPETDANFGLIFSVWDRIFGTYRQRKDYTGFRFGVRCKTSS